MASTWYDGAKERGVMQQGRMAESASWKLDPEGSEGRHAALFARDNWR